MRIIIKQLLIESLKLFEKDHPAKIDYLVDFEVRKTTNSKYGDYYTDIAFLLSKSFNLSPMVLAEAVVKKLPQVIWVQQVKIDKPGFINFFLIDKAKFFMFAQMFRKIQNESIRFSKSVGFKNDEFTPLEAIMQKKSIDSIQYALSRLHSLFYQLRLQGILVNLDEGLAHLKTLQESEEQRLIDLINEYSDFSQSLMQRVSINRLTGWLNKLAEGLHSYYHSIQLLCEHAPVRNARIGLLMGVYQTLRGGLTQLKLLIPESI